MPYHTNLNIKECKSFKGYPNPSPNLTAVKQLKAPLKTQDYFKKGIIFFAFLLSSQICFAQRTYKIYHGDAGRSEILKEDHGIGKQKTIQAKKGDVITIEVINPQPALYKYDFSIKAIKEEEDKITGLSGLTSLLSGTLTSSSNGRASARTATGSSWQDDFRDKLSDFKSQLTTAQQIINESDRPESIKDAVNNTGSSGFLHAKADLKSQCAFFSDKDLETTVKKWSADYKTTPYTYDATDATQKLIMDAFDANLMLLLKIAKEIQSAYSDDISTIVSYSITVGDSVQEVSLSIKNKTDDLKQREVGSNLITIRIEPYFNHSVLEFVPVAIMTFAKGGQKFSIKDNVINQEPDNDFKFRAGGILNFNFLSWEKRKNWALGAGVGFVISDNQLDNFFGNLMISYKSWARVGFGYGWLNVATHLNDGAQVGSALPANVTDLNKIIGYEKKSSFFITLVIPGLKLPILK